MFDQVKRWWLLGEENPFSEPSLQSVSGSGIFIVAVRVPSALLPQLKPDHVIRAFEVVAMLPLGGNLIVWRAYYRRQIANPFQVVTKTAKWTHVAHLSLTPCQQE
jgi:DNA polymerase III psi subunit